MVEKEKRIHPSWTAEAVRLQLETAVQTLKSASSDIEPLIVKAHAYDQLEELLKGTPVPLTVELMYSAGLYGKTEVPFMGEAGKVKSQAQTLAGVIARLHSIIVEPKDDEPK